jgi:hypothetical protein
MSKTKISKKLRAEIINRDHKKCLWCGKDVSDGIKLEIDHILSENFGGLTNEENLGTLCNECNNGKSNNYYGNYLLMTLLKISNLDNKICFEEFSKGNVCDNAKLRYFLIFLKKGINEFAKETIFQDFEIEGILYSGRKDDSAGLQIDLIKKDNFLKFKNKLKEYLIDNNGYLEELNGRIFFKNKN